MEISFLTKVASKVPGFKPSMPAGRMRGATDMVRQIGEAIYMLDLTIDQWSQQLDRAQPHRPGRLVIVFTKDSKTMLDGAVHFDISPVAGKMARLQGGGWRFFRLSKAQRYEKLSDLRVGKTLRSDPLVMRLIDGIEDMLKQREFLCDTLAALSRGMSGKLSAILASCARRADEAIDLSARVKLDWTLGAEKAEESIRAQRRERYARAKLKRESAPRGAAS